MAKKIEFMKINDTEIFSSKPEPRTFKNSNSLTLVGNCSINNGILSGFDSSSYCQIPDSMFPIVNSTEQAKIQLKLFHNNWNTVFSSNNNFLILNSIPVRLYFMLSNNSLTFNLIINKTAKEQKGYYIPVTDLTLTNWVYLTIEYRKNDYVKLEIRDENYKFLRNRIYKNATNEICVPIESTSQNTTRLGLTFNDLYPFTSGKIDLKETYWSTELTDWN